jgi:uncharacterized membrane protein
MTLQQITLAAAVTTAALMAGLFFAYSCSVSPGLGRLPDSGYVASMQHINRVIQNPVFFAAFFGALLLLPASAWLLYQSGGGGPFLLMAGAALVYLTGVFGVTILGNVPLNEALDRFILDHALPDAIAAQRRLFEAKWNILNNIRTITSLLAFVLALLAVMKAPGAE